MALATIEALNLWICFMHALKINGMSHLTLLLISLFITLPIQASTVAELCREHAEGIICDPEEIATVKVGSFLKNGLQIVDELDTGPDQLKLGRALYKLQKIKDAGKEVKAEDYIEVLKVSQYGQELLNCYVKAHPGRPLIDAIDSIENFPGIEDVKKQLSAVPEGFWVGDEKKIYMNFKSQSVVYSSILLAHEIQHACDDKHISELHTASDRDFTQGHLICELRGYQTSLNIFKEFAAANPEVACTDVMNSKLFSAGNEEGHNMTLGQLFNKVEVMEDKGNFILQVIRRYNMDPQYVFERNERGDFLFDSNGGLVLLPDMKSKLNELQF